MQWAVQYISSSSRYSLSLLLWIWRSAGIRSRITPSISQPIREFFFFFFFNSEEEYWKGGYSYEICHSAFKTCMFTIMYQQINLPLISGLQVDYRPIHSRKCQSEETATPPKHALCLPRLVFLYQYQPVGFGWPYCEILYISSRNSKCDWFRDDFHVLFSVYKEYIVFVLTGRLVDKWICINTNMESFTNSTFPVLLWSINYNSVHHQHSRSYKRSFVLPFSYWMLISMGIYVILNDLLTKIGMLLELRKSPYSFFLFMS